MSEQSTSITFGDAISLARFIKAQRLHARRATVGAISIFAVGTIGWSWYSDGSFGNALLFGLPGAVAWSALMLWWQGRQWKQIYDRSPYLADSVSGRILDDSLEGQGPTGRSEWPWDKFIKVRFAPDMLLLYQSPVLFVVLSREQFESSEAWERAKEVIGKKVRAA